MAKAKKYQHYEHYLLRGKLKKKGYARWRYVFTGVNRETNDTRVFFVEMVMLNPALSPAKAVIAQKSRPRISEENLQYALAGTEVAKKIGQEIPVQPSYVLVKAGCFGANARQHNKFFAANEFSWVKAEHLFKVGTCIFGTEELRGSVIVGEADLRAQPELLCSVGAIDWNLHFEKIEQTPPLYKKQRSLWIANGVKTQFSGTVHMFGLEYVVAPKKSNGYIDRSWGSSFLDPVFHISGSSLVSSITGQPLLNSCFTLRGEFDGHLRAFVKLEDEILPLNKRSLFEKKSEIHCCTQMPADADGDKLHWTVSIHKKRMVVDIDIYCKANEMLVRKYEVPEGGRQQLEIIGGGTGFGDIRIYKKLGKALELLEEARIEHAFCEFGHVDEPED